MNLIDAIYKSNKPLMMDTKLDYMKAYSSGTWPKASSSMAFIWEAINIVGRQKFPDDWTGRELLVVDWWPSPTEHYSLWEANTKKRLLSRNGRASKSPTTPYLSDAAKLAKAKLASSDAELEDFLKGGYGKLEEEQKEWEENRAAGTRLNEVVRQIGDWGRDGLLHGELRSTVSPSVVQEMDANDWACSSDFEHWMKTGTIKKYLGSAGPYNWDIFVSKGSLEKQMSILNDTPVAVAAADISRLSPELQIAVKVALDLKMFDGGNGKLDYGQTQSKLIEYWKAAGNSPDMTPSKAKTLAGIIRHSTRQVK